MAFGSLKHAAKRVGGQIKRSARQVGGIVKGQMGIGGNTSGDNSGGAADKGPQFTDAARQQAAGAGTVGFTQRTQNY